LTATAEWAEYAARDFEPKTPRWPTPGYLAKAIDPSTVQTPALDLIDEALVWAYSTPGARLAISIGPQEGKSSRVTKAGSLWALIRNPDTRIGIASYAQPLAEGFGRDIRNTITTNDGTDGTLDLGLRIAPDYGSAKRWQIDGHRGGIVCVGIGSGFTGRSAEVLVIDDPFADMKQAQSAYYREQVWGWYRSVATRRLAPGGPVILIMTRWHEDDLAGRLLGAEDGHRWRVINIPALADHDPAKGQSDPLGREPGEWMESARGRTPAEWEEIRIESGSRVFAALYQGRPSPDTGNVWLRGWWRRYHEPIWSQHPEIPGAYLVRDVDEVVMSWDLTFKDTKGSDYVAAGVLARRGADVYLLDVVRKRLSFTDTITAFAALVARWPQATRKLIEDKANGPAVISSLKSKIPGIVPVTPKDSKYARATAVAPFIEAGNVLLPDPEIALFDPEELITEAAGFPNAAHDDLVDMMSQGLAELLLDGTGAQAWIAWAKKKALAAAEATSDAEPDPAPTDTGPPAEPPTPVLTAAGVVSPSADGSWLARSSDGKRDYTVTPEGVCSCPAGQHGRRCRHVTAVALAGAAVPVPVDPVAARQAARNAAMRAQRGPGW
jgi:predicted phage terminase large subunit-like protein